MRMQIEGLTFSYGNENGTSGGIQGGVSDVSLQIHEGEFVGLIGPNGSGKSTLLKNVYRALAPDAGNITLDGENLLAMNYKKSAAEDGGGGAGERCPV